MYDELDIMQYWLVNNVKNDWSGQYNSERGRMVARLEAYLKKIKNF